MPDIKSARSSLRYFLKYGEVRAPLYSMSDKSDNIYVGHHYDGGPLIGTIIAIIEKRLVIVESGPLTDILRVFADHHKRDFKAVKAPLSPPSETSYLEYEAPNWETAPLPSISLENEIRDRIQETYEVISAPYQRLSSSFIDFEGLQNIVDDGTTDVEIPREQDIVLPFPLAPRSIRRYTLSSTTEF